MRETARKPARVRMFLCPSCQFKSEIEPKRRGEPVAKSACIHCYAVSENDKVETWLEATQEPSGRTGKTLGAQRVRLNRH